MKRTIIGKQYIDVSFEEVTDAFAIRDRLSWVCTTQLLPAIEKLLDENAPDDTVYYFERLVIDTGELPSENWESLFVEKVVSELFRYVSATSASFTPAYAQYDVQHDIDKGKNVRRDVTERESNEQTIFYFLETGLLPWNALIKSKEGLNEALAQLTTDRTALVKLIKLLHSNQKVLERLIQQFSNASLDTVILQAGCLPEGLLCDLKKSAGFLLKLTDVPAAEQRRVSYAILLKSISANPSIDHDAYIESVVTCIFRTTSVRSAFGETNGRIDNSEVLTKLTAETSAHQIKKAILSCLKDKITVRADNGALEDEKAAYKSVLTANVDEVYISNAGLVLLHPFLHLLFANTGYTEYTNNKVWISDETRVRAIALTQYMVTGVESLPEFDLLLNKILVGYPIAETLPIAIVLSDFEKQEADDVLTSVVKHWPALKNTTIAGLRSAFINREGKLYKDESSWNLKVEQKTADILLNRLPWGLSMVRTPWMDKMMKVEWA